MSSGGSNHDVTVSSIAETLLRLPFCQNSKERLSGDPSNGRHIYQSLDGGLTYTPVMSENFDDVFLTSGPLLVANPFDANRLHLFASFSIGNGGTRFYDYDLSTGIVQTIHNPNMTRIRSMEISRVTPEAIHVGFDYQ